MASILIDPRVPSYHTTELSYGDTINLKVDLLIPLATKIAIAISEHYLGLNIKAKVNLYNLTITLSHPLVTQTIIPYVVGVKYQTFKN